MFKKKKTNGWIKSSNIFMRMLDFNVFKFLPLMCSDIFGRFPNVIEPQLSHLWNENNSANSQHCYEIQIK